MDTDRDVSIRNKAALPEGSSKKPVDLNGQGMRVRSDILGRGKDRSRTVI